MLQIETPELLQKQEKITKDIEAFISQGKEISIKSDEDVQSATVFLGGVKKRLTFLEAMRKKAVAPLNAYVKDINNSAKVHTEPLRIMEDKIKNALKVYLDEKDRAARAEAARIRAEQEEQARLEQAKIDEARAKQLALEEKMRAEQDEIEKLRLASLAQKEAENVEALEVAVAQTPTEVIEAPQKTIRTAAGSVTRKMRWTYKVTDKKLLMKHYPDFFIVDEKKLNYAISEGLRNAPGIVIYQESEIAMKV
jgi:hypothetical protein